MIARKSRLLLFAIMFLLLGIGVVAGGTYALFTQNITVKTHLEAGKLDAQLSRISCVTQYLDDDGYMTQVTSNTVINYPSDNEQNVFGLDDKLIVPTCKEQATFELKNTGNVAFDYYLEFVLTDGQGNKLTDEQVNELAKQLKVKVELLEKDEDELVPSMDEQEEPQPIANVFNMSDLTESHYLINQSGQTIPVVGTVDKSTNGYFKVTVTFVDDGITEESARTENDPMNNNNAEEQTVNFDMIVHCVQNTTLKVIE